MTAGQERKSGCRWYWWHCDGGARKNLREESEKEILNLKCSDGFGEREIVVCPVELNNH